MKKNKTRRKRTKKRNDAVECECERNVIGCRAVCPQDADMKCSRNRNHKGEHFACTVAQHKVYAWGNDDEE